MHIFITGTDTNVGKTLISAWLCLHSKYKYFKPIQTGRIKDKDFVSLIINKENTYKEVYLYKQPVAPYLAAELSMKCIKFSNIVLPNENNLIIEGVGGLMVPVTQNLLMVDLIKYLNVPVIIVARTKLGTINHTLLSIHLLKTYSINILGVILTGKPNKGNKKAIEYYGKVKVLAEFPYLYKINKNILLNILLSKELINLFNTHGSDK